MKNLLNELKTFFRRKSLFFRTFLLTMLLSLVMMLAVIFLINRMVLRQQNGYITELRSSQLAQISDLVDLRINAAEKSLHQFMQSSDTISVMVNPINADSSLRSRILQQLQVIVQEDDSIKDAFLYLPFSGEVYDGAGTMTDYREYGQQSIIEAYLQENGEGTPGPDIRQSLFRYGDRIFLEADYFIAGRIGAAFFEIDLPGLTEFIRAKGFKETMAVLDSSGSLLMCIGEEAEGAELLQGPCECFESPATGWAYLCASEIRLEDGGVRGTIYIVLMLIAYLILSLFITFKLTYDIYRPIGRLIGIAYGEIEEEQTSRRGIYSQELKYLEASYFDTMEENQSQKELLFSMSDEISQQLFKNILRGTAEDRAVIGRTLAGIGRTDILQKQYMVMELDYRAADGGTPTLLENNLYQRSLRALAESFQKSELELQILFLSDMVMSLILLLEGSCPPGRCSLITAELENYLRSSTKGLPYTIVVGKGRIYNDIVQLKYSYQEALDDIRYKKLQSGAFAPGEPLLTDRSRYYRDKALQAADIAEKRTAREAVDLCGQLLTEIRETEADNAGSGYDTVLGVIRQRLQAYGVSGEEMAEAEPEKRDDSAAGVEARCAGLLRLLQAASQNKTRRYVRLAQEYISQHYAEGTLSLNEVSDAIGISAAYLSEVFSEVTKTGFSYYLNHYRVERAKEMLSDGNPSAAEVSERCGFNSAQNFARVFKKYTGMTPGQYRDEERQKESQ